MSWNFEDAFRTRVTELRRKVLMAAWVSAIFAAGLINGCVDVESALLNRKGAKVRADGVVTLDGKPVAEAKIVMLPSGLDVVGAPEREILCAFSDNEGRFRLRTASGTPGAAPGVYLVMVTKSVENPAAPASPLLSVLADESGLVPDGFFGWNRRSEMYKDPVPMHYNRDSELLLVVPNSGSNSLNLELKSVDPALR